MELTPFLRRLASLSHPDPVVATVTLDVSKSGILPPATRVFVKNGLKSRFAAPSRPPAEREALRKVLRRVETFLAIELKPETDGLFLAAGPGFLHSMELRTPLRNFVHLGRTPYLAPLLEAEARSPRAYVVEADARRAVVGELHLGTRTELASLEAGPGERQPQRSLSGRAVMTASGAQARSAAGGSVRDRYRQGREDAAGAMLRQAGAAVAAAHRVRPAAVIVYFGSRDHYGVFQENLPSSLRPLAEYGGASGGAAKVAAVLDRRAAEATRAKVREFLDRNAESHRVALGPGQTLEQLPIGTVRRVYVDPDDPLPGGVCADCGARHLGDPVSCSVCSGSLVPASMTQEVVAHALAHPPLDLTFVPAGAKWLRSLGGMAALLSGSGPRSRR